MVLISCPHASDSLNQILHSILHPADDLPRGKSIEAPASRQNSLPRRGPPSTYFRTASGRFLHFVACCHYLCIFLPICFSTVSYARLIDGLVDIIDLVVMVKRQGVFCLSSNQQQCTAATRQPPQIRASETT